MTTANCAALMVGLRVDVILKLMLGCCKTRLLVIIIMFEFANDELDN